MKFQSALACLVALSYIEDAAGAETVTLEMSVDLFASETGFYQIENMDVNRTKYLYPGPSPDLGVKVNNTYIFDQGSGSNWYHPVGFAYVPDGAHGTTWGGEEEKEVEAADALSYRLDGEVFECEDVGDTGLDCYEPLFFYPRRKWKKGMGKFSAQLTITPAVAEEAAKNGGVLYYFCHIHSKMSGRIIITAEYNSTLEKPLYPDTDYVPVFDSVCGTTGTSKFSRFGGRGHKSCNKRVFVPGKIDSQYEECLDAIDCKQYNEMRVPNADGHGDMVAVFSQQMISHHQNAVNMAKLSLKHYEDTFDLAGLKTILMSIINVQNFQVHQFRNYLGNKTLEPEWEDEQCDNTIDETWNPSRDNTQPEFKPAEGCTPSEFNLCMKIDMFASETGYYTIDRYQTSSEPSPDVHVEVLGSYTFDQSDPSNWYHPVGFAYVPDGAHGTTWGGEGESEVESRDALEYRIDGAATTCEAAGETGLDCYEPEFFYPQDVWEGKKYSAVLTITRAVADKAKENGGVLYYFCHIHSKMSGRIIITAEYDPDEEMALYPPVTRSDVDTQCGTTGLSKEFTQWDHRFLCGTLDKTFEKCVQSMDYKMSSDMRYFSSEDNEDPVKLFCEQMIPHHQNAVNMAKALIKHHPEEVKAVDDFKGLLMELINGQNYQIHQFRAYLEENPSDRFCRDFKGKVFSSIGDNNGQKCTDIASFTVCRGSTSLQSFCPKACGCVSGPVQCDVPCPTSCVDNEDTFFTKKGEDSCGRVAESGKNKRRNLCKNKHIAYMCPKTCGLC